jgi:ActR/RegA family two-component response regulator
MTHASDRPDPTVLIVDDHKLLSHALVIALGSRGLCAQQLTPHELLARLDQPATLGGLVLLDLDLGQIILMMDACYCPRTRIRGALSCVGPCRYCYVARR